MRTVPKLIVNKAVKIRVVFDCVEIINKPGRKKIAYTNK